MAPGRRIPRYAIGMIVVLIVLLFVARVAEPEGYSSRAFIESGFFLDKICTAGSYEMVVCPYTAPPYETLMSILGVLLIIFIWLDYRKK
jgi:hypothetical protein